MVHRSSHAKPAHLGCGKCTHDTDQAHLSCGNSSILHRPSAIRLWQQIHATWNKHTLAIQFTWTKDTQAEAIGAIHDLNALPVALSVVAAAQGPAMRQRCQQGPGLWAPLPALGPLPPHLGRAWKLGA
eukprot:1162037-Pelagomonas_calceolata.AAC.6